MVTVRSVSLFKFGHNTETRQSDCHFEYCSSVSVQDTSLERKIYSLCRRFLIFRIYSRELLSGQNASVH